MSPFRRYDPDERARYTLWQMWRFKLEGLALGLAMTFIGAAAWVWLT